MYPIYVCSTFLFRVPPHNTQTSGNMLLKYYLFRQAIKSGWPQYELLKCPTAMIVKMLANWIFASQRRQGNLVSSGQVSWSLGGSGSLIMGLSSSKIGVK